jgi:hypothetical protein
VDSRFIPTEHAVRTILSQVSVGDELIGQAPERADREGMPIPRDPVDRIQYIFTGR